MANTLKLGNGKWATGKDTVLAFNDENNNFKSLPFSLSRGSSATVVNKDGLIETVGSGEPRIDFKDNTKGALLLEPERTNLVLTSASGTYGNDPASEANTISPDGTNNAVIPTPDADADRYGYSISSGAYATNTKLVYSWYRKRISTPIDISFLGDLQIKNLVNVTQVGSTTQIQSDVNGFDRFQAVFNIADGSASSIIRGYFGNIVGIGNSSVAYFGHQLEVGEYATSYIPTSGSTVTRVAEVCNNGGNDQVINSTEGVLYADISALANDGTFRQITISDGSTSNRVYLTYSSTSNQFTASVISNGSLVFNSLYTSTDLTNNHKIAIKYKQNDFALWVNGIEQGTDTSGNAPSNLNNIGFLSAVDSLPFYGNVKDVRVYNNALTDAELQALTQ